VAIDREETLKKAEKLLRQGRLDAAIVEYQRVVDEHPRDWNTANTLGDCFYRAHQIDRAVEQYCRIADHFGQDGFYPKAAALYKKALKIKPDDEHALRQSAEIAIRQGTLVEAKQYLAALAEHRRLQGDAHGAADVLLRLGTLDPDDLDARLDAARAVAAAGGGERVAGEFRGVADALTERGERDRALEVLVEAARLLPDERTIRGALAAQFAARGDIARATEYATSAAEFEALADTVSAQGDAAAALQLLERAIAAQPGERSLAERLVRGYAAHGEPERAHAHLDALGDITEPGLLRLAAELRAGAGDYELSRGLFARLLAREPHLAGAIAERGAALAASAPDAALVHVESAAETLLLHGDFPAAAAAYQAFLRQQPGHVPATLRLVEICVDGDLDTLVAAQSALTDAYLADGRGEEARAVAEDLVTNHPDDPAQVARLRRALQLAGEPDIERAIAERRTAGSMASSDLGMDLTDEPVPEGAAPTPSHGSDLPPTAAVDVRPSVAATPIARPRAGGKSAADRDPFGLGPMAIDLGDILGDDSEASASGEQGIADAGEVDLSDALADLETPAAAPTAPPATLEGVFADFRDEIAKQSHADATEQHFKVGCTYQEMGMVPEAMKELELAVRAPRLRFEAASRLARLSLASSRPLEAVEWFERAAEAPAPTVEAGRTLLYDLADTLEGLGETARALAVFLELQSDAGDFRDVARRVERLARVQAGG